MSGPRRPPRRRDGAAPTGGKTAPRPAPRPGPRPPARGAPRAAARSGPRPAARLGPRPPARPLPGRPARAEGAAPPSPGECLLTTREGAETDLVEELALARPPVEARILAPALVVAARVPRREGRDELTFARQAFRIAAIAREPGIGALATALAPALARAAAGAPEATLHVWVPDTDQANPLEPAARDLHARVAQELARLAPALTLTDARSAASGGTPLLQICLVDAERAIAGVVALGAALSQAPGGRSRVHVPGPRPSRSSRKLAEALAWLGVGPEAGERCLDLGAAPGGWSYVLLERRARVTAVDPGRMSPELVRRPGLRVVKGSAFEFVADEPFDWIFCDMAFRPEDVARLLARLGREQAGRLLVSNFKLPMRRKAEMVQRLRALLEAGGWRGVRTRQLYHDRDEITVTARLG